ncbi:hypothetical protein [Mycobacterium sp.]|uniref:hypothetical protein n=1 Tax=Mycobacterium sp. TaxID=1785 RepID=UPI003F995CAB
MAHLEALPAYQLKEDLEALKRSLHTFSTNANELATHIRDFLISHHIARDVPDDYVNELVRRLHNYLTSVTSLIDSQRVVMRHRWPRSRSNAGICPTCNRPLPSKDALSEFEANDYAEKLAGTFETGERVFMSKLRNYCTHYSIPLPQLGTTWTFERGLGSAIVNTLQLDKAKLFRWDGWGSEAKEFLNRQAQGFDLAPIVERYVNAANQFAAWFWTEINSRSATLIDEMTSKATELELWHDENVAPPDWFERGEPEAPPGWNGRRWKAGLRKDRYELGTRGFRVWAVDTAGVIVLEKDDDWTPLQLRYY